MHLNRSQALYLSNMKHEICQNGAHVSFIGYKWTADWLLARILKWIGDRLILYPNHRTKLIECFQEYEGCLSATTSSNHRLVKRAR